MYIKWLNGSDTIDARTTGSHDPWLRENTIDASKDRVPSMRRTTERSYTLSGRVEEYQQAYVDDTYSYFLENGAVEAAETVAYLRDSPDLRQSSVWDSLKPRQ